MLILENPDATVLTDSKGDQGAIIVGLRNIYSNGTRDATSQLSSPVSSQRLGHSKGDAPSQLFTANTQPRHGGSNSSGGGLAIVTHRHM